jgi:hypothetical protein
LPSKAEAAAQELKTQLRDWFSKDKKIAATAAAVVSPGSQSQGK